MALTKEQEHWMAVTELDGATFNRNLEPCLLTDKSGYKVFPCRKCHRPCIVNRFASIAKTECTECREGSHAPTQVAEFDRSKETHVLTDKDETKEVPCRSCGRPCVVNQFAAPAKVACNDCRGSVSPPKRKVSIEQDDSGRFREKVSIEGPGNIQWTEWTIGAPMDINRLYLPDERKEFESVRSAALEATQEAKRAKDKRRAAEDKLNSIPDKPRKVDKKEAKEEKKRLDTERQAAEEERDQFDQLEVQQLDLRKTKEERQTELARIAYIRGALAIHYQVVERDGRRRLVRGERDVAIPDDFLSNKGYEISMNRENVDVAA